ncbi:MAG: hormogonium polysaccharide secretion pseudopilin HpsB [Oscillatoria sp. PMC 1068.18]|nr:hormogonium polysaccharide secretion pseudopilin HpsB [Oscillatoria sp. PMC 1076.18]MEC4989541.1 hormogonium polysaccharide secretion pseudopilin HpsB [Oscillatoria sp. PMC 1068.18]
MKRILKQAKLSPDNSEAGLTIIESLMAVLVVGILLVGIYPMIAVAVANRVQARRVELATQAAKSYINGIRSGSIEPPAHTIELDTPSGDAEERAAQVAANRAAFVANAPTSGDLSGCPATQDPAKTANGYCTNANNLSLYCFDLDQGGCSADSSKDVIVQAYRSDQDLAADADLDYYLGLRVYSAYGFKNASDLERSTKEENAKATTISFNPNLPLVEISTEMASAEPKFSDYCDRLGCESNSTEDEE